LGWKVFLCIEVLLWATWDFRVRRHIKKAWCEWSDLTTLLIGSKHDAISAHYLLLSFLSIIVNWYSGTQMTSTSLSDGVLARQFEYHFWRQNGTILKDSKILYFSWYTSYICEEKFHFIFTFNKKMLGGKLVLCKCAAWSLSLGLH